jgi:hypothetical protein
MATGSGKTLRLLMEDRFISSGYIISSLSHIKYITLSAGEKVWEVAGRGTGIGW